MRSQFPAALRGSSILKTSLSTIVAAATELADRLSIFDGKATVRPFVMGAPLGDRAAILMRQMALAQITGGAGFRVYPNKPAKLINGKTRAERKQEARNRANAAVSAYHGDVALARNKNLIGTTYVSPDQLRRLLTQNPDTIKSVITNETVVVAPKSVMSDTANTGHGLCWDDIPVARPARETLNSMTVARPARETLNSMTVTQLRETASDHKVKATAKMTKAQLIDAIVGA